jgi:signal peptidase II
MKNFFVLRIRRLCLVFALVFSTIGCDQVTKIAARVAISIFLLLLAVQIWRRPWNLPVTVAASLILGGGIGNVIDRVARGNVIDFLNFGIGNVRTGIFNIADVAIMAGVFLLAIHSSSRTAGIQRSKVQL